MEQILIQLYPMKIDVLAANNNERTRIYDSTGKPLP